MVNGYVEQVHSQDVSNDQSPDEPVTEIGVNKWQRSVLCFPQGIISRRGKKQQRSHHFSHQNWKVKDITHISP